MKNYFKIIITTIFIFFSLNINASEGINASECNQKIKNIFQEIKLDFDEKEPDAAIRENLTEKVFDKILGDAETLNEKRDNLAINLGSCLASPIEKDIAIKILRILYGEVLNNPIKIISGIWGSFWDKDMEVDVDRLNNSTDIINVVPDLIKSYNNIIFIVALLIFSVVYGKELLSLLNKENTKTLQFLGKNTLRILTGFSMIAPLPLFEGYSLIQFIFIIMLILSVLLAKILWLFILLSINFSYFEKDLAEIVEQQQVKESFQNSISSNIMMHYCDIVKREKYLEKDLEEFNNKKSLLDQNEYYQCLKTQSPVIDDTKFIPKQISIGQQCSIDHKEYYTSSLYYCGFIENFSQIPTNKGNPDLNDEAKIQREVYRELGIESDEFQGKLREIALSFRSYVCRLNGNNIIDPASSPFKCPILNGKEYEYNIETDYIVFNNQKFTNEDQRRDELNRIANDAKIDLEAYIDQKIDRIVLDFLAEDEANDENSELEKKKLENFITLYEKGFAMAGSVFYEKIDYIQPSYHLIEQFKKSYIVDTTVQVPLIEDRTKLENLETGLNTGQVVDIDYETVVILANTWWNDELLADKENRSIMIGIGELVNSKTSCVVDFRECHVNSINPFLDLMHYGNEMVIFGTYARLAVGAVEMFYNRIFSEAVENENYAANRGNDLLGFIGNVLNIYIIVGYFFSVFLPFIPFFTFAALFFGWILQGFKVIFASQLLSLYFIVPDEREDFAGKEKKIYKLLIKTALTPLFLITGFVVTLILANISISLINVWLSIMLDNLNLYPNLTSILGILNGVIGVMIYAVLVTLAILKANEAIAGIPKAISSWLDIQIEEEKTFNQLKSLVETHIIPNMKGKLFF